MVSDRITVSVKYNDITDKKIATPSSSAFKPETDRLFVLLGSYI